MGGGDLNLVIPWQGLDRKVLVHAPPGPPRPLLLALHGTGGTGRLMSLITGLSRLADSRGLAVAYPQALGEPGSEDPARGAAWNAGPGLGCPAFPEADDTGFLLALADRLAAEGVADPARVFVAGLSNGGRMAFRLATEAPERLAGLAVVAGAPAAPPEGTSPKPLPTLILHGTEDAYIPFEGGVGPRGRAVPVLPAREAAARWARRQGCEGRPRRILRGRFLEERHEGPAPTSLWVLPGEGHAWPGGRAWSKAADKPAADLDASGLILDFFLGAAP